VNRCQKNKYVNLADKWENTIAYTADGLARKKAANMSIEDQSRFADEALVSIRLGAVTPERWRQEFSQMCTEVYGVPTQGPHGM
jgi:hypothetical protein